MSTTSAQQRNLSSSRQQTPTTAFAQVSTHAGASHSFPSSPFAAPKPKHTSLSRSKSKQARAARSRLARKKSTRAAFSAKRMASLRRSFSRSMRMHAFNPAAENTMPLTRRASNDMDMTPSLARRSSLGDRLHSTNPLAATPSFRPKLNRRGMLALHFQSFVSSRGDPMAALNPMSGVATSAARNAAEVVTTSMDVMDAFQDKAPLKQLTGKEIAARMARGESLFTPFG